MLRASGLGLRVKRPDFGAIRGSNGLGGRSGLAAAVPVEIKHDAANLK